MAGAPVFFRIPAASEHNREADTDTVAAVDMAVDEVGTAAHIPFFCGRTRHELHFFLWHPGCAETLQAARSVCPWQFPPGNRAG